MSQEEQEYRTVIRNFRLAGGFVVILLSVGSVFYHIVEKLNWVDAIYFCTVTLATVGYGDITPKTEAGKLFTIFYILAGVGVLATFANLLLKRSALRREIRKKKR